MGASRDIGKAMLKLYPDKCRIITIPMLYEKEVIEYVMEIEEAHKKAARSKLTFRSGFYPAYGILPFSEVRSG